MFQKLRSRGKFSPIMELRLNRTNKVPIPKFWRGNGSQNGLLVGLTMCRGTHSGRVLCAAEGTREARVAGVVEECCDHIDDFRPGLCVGPFAQRGFFAQGGGEGMVRGFPRHRAPQEAAKELAESQSGGAGIPMEMVERGLRV